MKGFRIIRKTYLNGDIRYLVQERVFYFFWTKVERDCFFYMHLSIINSLNPHEEHPANLVGKKHESYIDALEEVAYHEYCKKSRTVTKDKVVS